MYNRGKPMTATKSKTKKTAKKAPAVKKVTLDDVWANMRELQELHKETEKAIKETQKIVGKLGNRLGDMAEHLLTPDLVKQFKKYGFNFGRMGQNVSMKDKENDIYAEIDAMLENGTQAMAVEVKVNLTPADVDEHTRRMEKIRRYADLHGDKRQYYGAVAGTVVKKDVELYAIRHGFYVIKPSGEDVTIVPPVSKNIFW
jgi:hypothetical protein